jgi:hypothetical protein
MNYHPVGVSQWTRLVTAALAAVTVAGCAAFERPVQYVPYQQDVPVPVPCAAPIPAEPAWDTGRLKKSDTLDDKAKALLAEREQRQGYEDKLKAAVGGCQP